MGDKVCDLVSFFVCGSVKYIEIHQTVNLHVKHTKPQETPQMVISFKHHIIESAH